MKPATIVALAAPSSPLPGLGGLFCTKQYCKPG